MNAEGTKRVIGPLSPPPSAYTEDVVFTHPGGNAELRRTYERNGAMYAGGLRFSRVRAYRFRAEGHCTPARRRRVRRARRDRTVRLDR